MDDAPEWYAALTLGERARDLPPPSARPAGDPQAAARRVRRWRDRSRLDDGLLARRLAAAGLGEEDFLYLLGEPPAGLKARQSAAPPWLAAVFAAFTRAVAGAGDGLAGPRLPDSLRNNPSAGFLAPVLPLLQPARERLRGALAALEPAAPGLFTPEAAERLLFPSLAVQSLKTVSRTGVLELNIARLRGDLPGDTPERRFVAFLQRLRDPGAALGLLREYPVIARLIQRGAGHWAAFGAELLGHLAADLPGLAATFSPGEDPGPLADLHGGLGDLHRGGRSVQKVRFRSGLEVVYKPRSLAIDLHFQELLTWLGERGQEPRFETFRSLDREDHGWAELIRQRPCGDRGEVERFYLRLGGYLALLYALEAIDFHYENLIAAGEHPFLVDLESLFHPQLEGPGDGRVPPALQEARRRLGRSVLRISVLPVRVWAQEGEAGIDLSGLGGAAGQVTPFDVPVLAGLATDAMRFVPARREIPAAANRPTLQGEEVRAADYADALAAGFESTYRRLARHRGELLAFLERFADDPVRVILRPTNLYARLLEDAGHPDLLRDALERDALFDQLWAAVDQLPAGAGDRIVAAEQDSLRQGDIPLFLTRANSRDLWAPDGERLPGVFRRSGLDLVRERVAGLGEEDLARQSWLIRASIASSLPAGSPEASGTASPAAPPAAPPSGGLPGKEELLREARAVGDRLAALAVRSEGQAAWLGLIPGAGGHLEVGTLGLDLYAGLPGVALFLAELGAAAGEDGSPYTGLGREAWATVEASLAEPDERLEAVGAFVGWGGILYTLSRLAALWRDPGLLERAEAILAFLPDLIARDRQLDVMAGAAGCLAVLLSLPPHLAGPRVLAAARLCGERLLAAARPAGAGLGWPGGNAAPSALPGIGFAHGAAGIGWALLRLGRRTGDERFHAAAAGAFAYERGLFCAAADGWPDLTAAEPSWPTSWCRGAAGIGLSRLDALAARTPGDLGAEPLALCEEIAAAARRVQEREIGVDHTPCHGDLGRIELLARAGEALGAPELERAAGRAAAAWVASLRRGRRCGVPLGVETPGLMTGLAGIGCGLLRLADPGRFPSLLTLAASPELFRGGADL